MTEKEFSKLSKTKQTLYLLKQDWKNTIPLVGIQLIAATHIILKWSGFEFPIEVNYVMLVLLFAGLYHSTCLLKELEEKMEQKRKKNLDKFR